jgi:hypothetical protein
MRAPRWPERGVARMALERAVPTAPMAGTPGAVAVSVPPTLGVKHYSRALPWIEFIAGCFGFHGVGLFLLGKRGRGTIWLLLSLIKHAIGAGLIVITFGLALACLIPLDVALSLYLATATWRSSIWSMQRSAQVGRGRAIENAPFAVSITIET